MKIHSWLRVLSGVPTAAMLARTSGAPNVAQAFPFSTSSVARVPATGSPLKILTGSWKRRDRT
jgi:hypothetical protein